MTACGFDDKSLITDQSYTSIHFICCESLIVKCWHFTRTFYDKKTWKQKPHTAHNSSLSTYLMKTTQYGIILYWKKFDFQPFVEHKFSWNSLPSPSKNWMLIEVRTTAKLLQNDHRRNWIFKCTESTLHEY